EPLGSIKSIKTDVRVITATNKNLYEMLNQQQFRKDLYYRLNVINITIPPLRDRKEDIPLLVDYFIRKLNIRQKKQIRGVSDNTMASLLAYDFPGNVRELENCIEHAFVLCSRGYINKKHLPKTIYNETLSNQKEDMDIKSFKKIEKVFLLNALRRNNWSRQNTANELGINRSSLYRKMRALGIYQDHV
ncbi:MAG: sigma 54-interacting transcriptional regulator, partial [Chitinispirillia bacterium]